MDQATRCEAVEDAGATCILPTIRYGTTSGGVPADASETDLAAFCLQLGFSGYATHKTGPRDCSAPAGLVFWGSGYDEETLHWIDYEDGFWLSADLDKHECDPPGIVTLTCVQ